MKITVTLIPSNTLKTVDIRTGATFLDLLQKLHLKPDSSVILQRDIPIPVDDNVIDGEEYEVIKVASGG